MINTRRASLFYNGYSIDFPLERTRRTFMDTDRANRSTNLLLRNFRENCRFDVLLLSHLIEFGQRLIHCSVMATVDHVVVRAHAVTTCATSR